RDRPRRVAGRTAAAPLDGAGACAALLSGEPGRGGLPRARLPRLGARGSRTRLARSAYGGGARADRVAHARLSRRRLAAVRRVGLLSPGGPAAGGRRAG